MQNSWRGGCNVDKRNIKQGERREVNRKVRETEGGKGMIGMIGRMCISVDISQLPVPPLKRSINKKQSVCSKTVCTVLFCVVRH